MRRTFVMNVSLKMAQCYEYNKHIHQKKEIIYVSINKKILKQF